MEAENMSNLTCASGEASGSSVNRNDNGGGGGGGGINIYPTPLKKKRNQPGHPDPGAEVIALSPRSLLATNRFVCEVCNKGFQRDQNLQLHRRGHNLPWKLKQRTSKEVRKKVYICPEVSCVHHDPSRALGDLTGIKKHFYRKHGEKKWKCEKCSKKYAVQSDWKAHSKICGTREYRCECGTVFSRRDSFITHRAFCDALAQENARSITRNNIPLQNSSTTSLQSQFNNVSQFPIKKEQKNFTTPPWLSCSPIIGPPPPPPPPHHIDLTTASSLIFQDHFPHNHQDPNPNPSFHHPPPPSPYFSATALLQKAAQMGSKSSNTTPHFPSHSGGVFMRPHQHNQAPHVSASTTDFGTSRDDFIHGLSSYGNKAAAAAAAVTGGGGSTEETGATLGGNSSSTHLPSPPLNIHEMMMINNAGGLIEAASAFDDITFAEMLNNNSKNASGGQFSSSTTSHEGGENMTRDFLGLRPLSQSEILSMTAFDNCINGNSSCNHN